jgi:hypothetical protein
LYNPGVNVIRKRRLLVLVCIAVLVATAMVPAAGWVAPAQSPMWTSAASLAPSGAASPAADLLFDVVASLGPLFGTVVSVPLPPPDIVDLATAAFLSVRACRAPPLA